MHPYGKNGRIDVTGKRLIELQGYLLAVGAEKYDIDINALLFYSNHNHLTLEDVLANMPRFFQWFNGLLARGINFLRGRQESVWAPGSYNAVALNSEDRVLDKIAYTMMQPVKDGIVEKASHWGGLSSQIERMFEPRTFERDSDFFRDDGPLQDVAVLQVKKNRLFENVSDSDYVEMIKERCERLVVESRAKRTQSGKRVLGRKALRNLDWTYTPAAKSTVKKKTIVKLSGGKEKVVNNDRIKPRFAYRTAEERREQASRHKRFQRDHRQSLDAYLAGDTDVLFPYGTYKMRVQFGVRCRGPD